MKIAAIIAEYNPFHNGHFRQVHILKDQMGYDQVIAIMSPDFVQRGEPALLGMYDRAKAAMAGGVDAVFSLPVCLATGSAEYFAEGGVGIAHGFGAVDALCFGCETPDTDLLHRIASVTNEEPPIFREMLRQRQAAGIPFPAARAEAIRSVLNLQTPSGAGTPVLDFLKSPNNILAIEYMRAILKLGSHLKPLPILREGSAYHDARLMPSSGEEPVFPSAAALRETIKRHLSDGDMSSEQGIQKSLDLIRRDMNCAVPPETLDILMEGLTEGKVCSTDRFDLLMHFALLQFSKRSVTGSDSSSSFPDGTFQDMSPELAVRIAGSAGEFRTAASYAAFLHTKNLTLARVNRALLHVLLGIPRSLPEAVRSRIPDGEGICFPNLYTQLIGFRREASGLIRELQEQSSVPIIVKPASAKKLLTGAALQSFDKDMYAQEIYNMIRLRPAGRVGCRKTVEIQ